MSAWQVGLATVTFLVDLETQLGGYADRTGPSTGTHDDLELSAMMLSSSDMALYLVTADVVAVDQELVAEVATQAGIQADRLLIGASHTHSGPLGVVARLHPAGPVTLEPALRKRFVDAIVKVIAASRENLAPRTLAFGEGEVVGAWSSRNDPRQSVDSRLRSLVVQESDGTLAGLVLLIPCHPTVLGSWNREVSADLHGSIRRSIRQQFGTIGTILTLTGAAGDVSTRFMRRESSFAESDRLGVLVGSAVEGLFTNLQTITPGLKAQTVNIHLPVRPTDTIAIENTLREAQAAWQATLANPTASKGERRLTFTRLQGAELQQQLSHVEDQCWPMSVWHLGEQLRLVTIPGELFSSLGMAIEHKAGLPETWVVGYVNGYAGYLVDNAAHAQETYEALASPWTPEPADLVVSTAVKLLREETNF